MKELNQLAADIVYDWEHRERYGPPEGYTEGDELYLSRRDLALTRYKRNSMPSGMT
jgi:hypothetical protein